MNYKSRMRRKIRRADARMKRNDPFKNAVIEALAESLACFMNHGYTIIPYGNEKQPKEPEASKDAR